jgi:6-phosphogluconate dehydrogenase
MELGMIGLGRMGANMTERLLRGGHKLITYDRSPEAIQRCVDRGARHLADGAIRRSSGSHHRAADS